MRECGSNVGPISNRTCPVVNRTYWSSVASSVDDGGDDAGGRFSRAEFLIVNRFFERTTKCSFASHKGLKEEGEKSLKCFVY